MKQPIRIHKAIPNRGLLNASDLLDAPAGKHGFVEVQNGHYCFANGQRIRFFGVNLPARSNTPTHETAEKMAERFASLGINVVRLHAADLPPDEEPCSWTSCMEAPLLDYNSGSSRRFHPAGRERFDYFCAKLKEKGIYLHIDLLVARCFKKGDGLEYPINTDSILPPGECLKCYTMVNRRLIELQKEYARTFLCHVNPYTGLSLADDPAVMTIQINNEDSVLKGTEEYESFVASHPYQLELEKRFSHFLLMKYGTRENLAEAWTFNSVCVLSDQEDPNVGNVKLAQGDFLQRYCEPMGPWTTEENPARYADTLAFGIWMNEQYYQEMTDFLHALGVRVPISTSNLLGGAADVFSHAGGDVMENNSYYHAPIFPVIGSTYRVKDLHEYVSLNPLTMHYQHGPLKTTILSLAAEGVVSQKPFLMSEWNEYGMLPFHSTAFASTVAYACLNDWDGLILYAHHTSENWEDQPADEIQSVFDAYNDPSLIAQFPFLARVFLKGLITPAKTYFDVVYQPNDLLGLPKAHDLPFSFLPYIGAVRSVFLNPGQIYDGKADVVINAGFFSGNGNPRAQKEIVFSWSPYRDPQRRFKQSDWPEKETQGMPQCAEGLYQDERKLVFAQIADWVEQGDYRRFASAVDNTLKKWNIIQSHTGLIDGALISATGEIRFAPEESCFEVITPKYRCFSGAPSNVIQLTERVSVLCKNSRITLTAITNGTSLEETDEWLLTAVGETGMSKTMREYDTSSGITTIHLAGKLYADVLEGVIEVKTQHAVLTALSPTGELMANIPGICVPDGMRFDLHGDLAALHYHLVFAK